MKGYLLDTNHVSAWEAENASFITNIEARPDAKMLVCAITLGEIDAGHKVTKTTNQARRDEFDAFCVRHLHPHALPLTLHTRAYYGEIVSRLWAKNPPTAGKRTETHLATLGIDVNDVWIVAVAWEHNLTLLTNDRMRAIKLVVPEVNFESWI